MEFRRTFTAADIKDAIEEDPPAKTNGSQHTRCNGKVVGIVLLPRNKIDSFLSTRFDLEKFETGSSPSDKPWEVDGKRWHLEERTSEDTAALVQDLVDGISKLEALEGPRWTQKIYIAFRIEGTNRVLLRTRTNSVRVDIHDFDIDDQDELLERAIDLVGDSELVVLDTDFHENRERLRLKYRPGDDVDIDRLNNLISDLILS
jgi:hypothetical protein